MLEHVLRGNCTEDTTMNDEETGDDISPEEFWYWSEFCSWVAFILSPLLWWLNGPSVSADQFWVRSGLVTISAVAAFSIRIRKLIVASVRPVDKHRQQSPRKTRIDR
jgi:hypothetical protein